MSKDRHMKVGVDFCCTHASTCGYLVRLETPQAVFPTILQLDEARTLHRELGRLLRLATKEEKTR